MSIFTVLIIMCLVGVALWAVNRWLPLDPNVRKLINVVIVALLAWWILSLTGILSHIGDAKVPRV